VAVVRKYARDVENPGAPGRIASEPMGRPADADSKVPFACEYLGRRVDRKVLDWDLSLNGAAGAWDAGSPTKDTRFVWSGWLPGATAL